MGVDRAGDGVGLAEVAHPQWRCCGEVGEQLAPEPTAAAVSIHPAYGRHQHSARQSVCQHQLRRPSIQVMTGISLGNDPCLCWFRGDDGSQLMSLASQALSQTF